MIADMYLNGGYIDYYNLDQSVEMKYFQQRQQFLMQNIEKKMQNARITKINAVLGLKQKEYADFQKTLESKLAQSLKSNIGSNNLDIELSQLSENIDGYWDAAIESSDAVVSRVKQRDYMQAYWRFGELINQVLTAPGGVEVDTKIFEDMLKKLNLEAMKEYVHEIGNSLGYIGELSGMVLLTQIANDMLTSLEGTKAGKDLKITITNTGTKNTINTNKRVKTDNIAVFSSGNDVLFTLNLSSKFNNQYSERKKTTTSVKLVSQTIGSFLSANPEYSPHVYNTISYHWDTNSDIRRDLLGNMSALMRETIGGQMLYDHILGTGDYVSMGQYSFEDTISLVNYGGKIYTTYGILDVVRKRKKFNKAQISMNNRNSWVPGGMRSPSIIQNIYDAQRRIDAFNMTYTQSLGNALN